MRQHDRPSGLSRYNEGRDHLGVTLVLASSVDQQAAQDDLAAILIQPSEGLQARPHLARLEPDFFDLIRCRKRHNLSLSRSLEG